MTHKNTYTLGELAKLLDLELIGDEKCEISGLGTLSGSGSGKLSFLSNPAYIDQLSSTSASAVILQKKFADSCPVHALVSEAPYVSFAKASALFVARESLAAGIHASAYIHPDAVVADSATIGPQVVIEAGASIGEGTVVGAGCFIGSGANIGTSCHLYNNVSIYHGVVLADRVIIHAGAVIGADGFGFAFDGEKSIKIHQLGGVRIGSDVEIGAGSTIDRGAIEDTVVEQGVKIDNQVQIGHNCRIGKHSIICGCTALAGSVTIGQYCIMGGASGAVGHITIADKVQVSAMSLVSQSITEPGMYSSGTGHMKTSEWKRTIVRFQQLDSIAKRLKVLEQLNDKS